MEKGTSGVYALTCAPTGRKYIGSSGDVRERWWRHRYRLRTGQHHIKAMQLDWNEHGESAFTFVVTALCVGREERFAAEQAAIDEAMAAGLCYNPSPTARTAKGYRPTVEQVKAMSDGHRGHATSEETRRKIGEANRARWAEREVSPEQRARMAEMGRAGKGRPKSAGHRAKISAAQKGRKKTPEHLAKLSASLKGRVMSAETRRKIGESGKGHPGYSAKITEDQAREIKRRIAAGERTGVLATEFGLTPSTISAIKSGKSWARVTI